MATLRASLEATSGSVMANADRIRPSNNGFSHRSFCASVPRLAMVAAPRPRLTPRVLSSPMLTPASSDTSTAAIEI